MILIKEVGVVVVRNDRASKEVLVFLVDKQESSLLTRTTEQDTFCSAQVNVIQ